MKRKVEILIKKLKKLKHLFDKEKDNLNIIKSTVSA